MGHPPLELRALGNFGRGCWLGPMVTKVPKVSAGPSASGFFDSGAHGEAVNTSAQNDRV
jgi:hypothetical protein